MASYYHALMFHAEHLAGGDAYLKDCPYCEMCPRGDDYSTRHVDKFYSDAQRSGRKSIPLSEMP